MDVQTSGDGYSAPVGQPPEDDLEDLVNEKVSMEAASVTYAVRIDLEYQSVDQEATEAVRT